MSCDSFRARLIDAAGDAELAAHLRDCPACRAVHAEWATRGERGDHADVFVALQRQVAADRGALAWLKSLPTAARRALLMVSLSVVVLIAFTVSRRADWDVYPAWRMAVELGGMAIVMATLARGGIRHALNVTSPRATWALLGLLVATVAALMLAPPAHAGHPASLAGSGAELVPRALRCLGWGLICAIPTALMALAIRRSPEPDLRRDLLVGAAATVTGVAALSVHCPITHTSHLVLGHASVVVVGVAVFIVITQVRWARR